MVLVALSCRVGWLVIFFFFKQKTAYEMRISDWSSDVCSSDLLIARLGKEGVPNPAVIAIMAAGAAPRGASDSSYWLLGLTGAEVRAPAEMPKMPSYFTAQDMADPLAFPANSPEMLAKFPPTLVLSSS